MSRINSSPPQSKKYVFKKGDKREPGGKWISGPENIPACRPSIYMRFWRQKVQRNRGAMAVVQSWYGIKKYQSLCQDETSFDNVEYSKYENKCWCKFFRFGKGGPQFLCKLGVFGESPLNISHDAEGARGARALSWKDAFYYITALVIWMLAGLCLFHLKSSIR